MPIPTTVTPRPSAARPRLTRWFVVVAALLLVLAGSPQSPAVVAQDGVALRVAGADPLTWDPALAGDTTSVTVLAQVFETLTAFGPDNRVQPALAESWNIAQDGRQIEFQLRSGLRYSDGSPITGQDVVDCWFRVLDPQNPSPLASILADVRGANDYLAGRAGREQVGLRADGDRVIVELHRPATFFLAVTGSPTLAVVPRSMWDRLDTEILPAQVVVSGAYRPAVQTATAIRLEANPNYWAGQPPLGVIEMVTDLGGGSPVTAFETGAVDYVRIGPWDASWIRYDRTLGPQLRGVDDFVVHYYGFDTTVAPFDDVRVRRAFAQSVDWDRMVRLGDREPARSMVPAGVPGGGDEDFRPPHDPDAARDLLAQAGFPGGAGFPPVTLISHGYGFEVAVADQISTELGVPIAVEFLEFADFLQRRRTDDRPSFWNMAWSADYPHAHDFLGLLLETGSVSNEGDWSNADYDALIAAAAATDDPDEQAELYAQAQRILREEAPVVPVDHGQQGLRGWALSREGLLGALPSGVGYLRFAGLDWAPGTGP